MSFAVAALCLVFPAGVRLCVGSAVGFPLVLGVLRLLTDFAGSVYLRDAVCLRRNVSHPVETHLDPSGDQFPVHYDSGTVGSDDRRADLRDSAHQVFVSVLFMLQAAHQPAACAGYFDGIERQPLFLCHLDGHRLKIAHKFLAAEGSAAYAKTSEHLCLIPHADLTQFDPRAEYARQILHQLAEIHTSFSREVEHDLAVVEGAFHLQQIHIQSARLDFLIAYVKGFFCLDFILIQPRDISVVSFAYNGLDLTVEFAVVYLAALHHNLAAFGTANRLDNHVTADPEVVLIRTEVVNLSAILESNSNYLRHYFLR